jgi:hypothetical protein
MVHKWDKFFIMYKFIFTNKLISLYIRSNMKYYIINYSNCENNLVHGDKLDSQKWQIIRNGVTIFNIDFKDLYTRLYRRSKTTFFLLKRYLFWKRTKKIYFDYVYYSHNLFWLCVFWTCNVCTIDEKNNLLRQIIACLLSKYHIFINFNKKII